MTIKDVFTDFRMSLATIYDPQEIEALTLLVINEITSWSKAKIKAFPELVIDEASSTQIAAILSRLKTGEPIQYILGNTEFYGLPFKVNPSVLIPRPETEELVEWAIESIGNLQLSVDSWQLTDGSSQLAGARSKFKILDIGTGSGCIAISLKKNISNANVTAMDISSDALATAQQNAELNNVDIEFFKADILTLDFENDIKTSNHLLQTENYSLIISNPPYVTLEDKNKMHVNITDFEPHTALFVPEDDPLLFYRAIANFATTHLVPNGLLFLEINESLGQETVNLLEGYGFKDTVLRKDMSGRDRMIRAEIKQQLSDNC